MSYQYTEKDSETWILLFLYRSPPKTIEDIVEDGCHKMILKISFDDLLKLLDKMTESDLIEKRGTPSHYVLKARGIHKLKNLILTPLLDLTSDQARRIKRESDHHAILNFLKIYMVILNHNFKSHLKRLKI